VKLNPCRLDVHEMDVIQGGCSKQQHKYSTMDDGQRRTVQVTVGSSMAIAGTSLHHSA